MKSESYIIVELGAALLILSFLSFFFIPAYEKGAWFAIGVFSNGFSLVLGYKFGKGMPEQAGDAKPGQTSQSETTTKVSTQAPPEAPQP
jgi:hypothetical protein